MGLVTTLRPTLAKKAVFFQSLINVETMKILVATEKPFAKAAVDGIREIIEGAGYELALLEKYADKADLLAAVKDADGLIIRSDKVTAEAVAAAEKLKIVVRAGAGYDNVDLAACTAKGIVVMNTPGQNSNAVAELVVGMMVFMARNQFTPGTGSEISGKRLGIQAYGNVGRIDTVGREPHLDQVVVLDMQARPTFSKPTAWKWRIRSKSCMLRPTFFRCTFRLPIRLGSRSVTSC